MLGSKPRLSAVQFRLSNPKVMSFPCNHLGNALEVAIWSAGGRSRSLLGQFCWSLREASLLSEMSRSQYGEGGGGKKRNQEVAFNVGCGKDPGESRKDLGTGRTWGLLGKQGM